MLKASGVVFAVGLTDMLMPEGIEVLELDTPPLAVEDVEPWVEPFVCATDVVVPWVSPVEVEAASWP